VFLNNRLKYIQLLPSTFF